MHKQPHIHIDIHAQPLVACTCGNVYFVQAFQFHQVPRFLLGASEDSVIVDPKPAFQCSNLACGKIYHDPRELIKEQTPLVVGELPL